MHSVKYFKIVAALAVSSVFMGSTSATKVFSCAQVFSPKQTVAQIAAENALILYNEKNGIEDFIRQAVFDPTQDAKDFGFLVPTPTPPTLSTADSKLLSQVDSYTAPLTIYDTKWGFFTTPRGASNSRAFSASPRDWVEVTEQHVGDMDAAIMQASDAKTLRHWLTEHGYATRPALDKWLASYIKRGWTITAFKVAGSIVTKDTVFTDEEETERVLTPVRMTFRTAHPFYPYQEPGEKKRYPSPYRKLRILYAGPQRVSGKLSGDTPGMFPTQEEEWATRAKISRVLTESQREEIARLAHFEKNETVGERLTLFEEIGDHRPSDKDLYLLPSSDQSPYEPVILHETVYHDAGAFIVLGIGGLTILGTTLLIHKKRNLYG